MSLSSRATKCFGELSEDGIAVDSAQESGECNFEVMLVPRTKQAET